MSVGRSDDVTKLTTVSAETVDATRERLLDAGEVLFAECGFEGTSVRDVTGAAVCNVAAVSYHFGSKEGLYVAVFERRLDALREIRLAAVRQVVEQAVQSGRLEDLLQAFVAAFLQPMLDPKRGGVMMRLFMRELNDPRLPPGEIVRRMIGPIKSAMLEAMCRVRPNLDRMTADLCLHSVVGQLVHVLQVHQIMRGAPPEAVPMLDMPRVVDHVVRFSLAGIEAVARERAEGNDHE